MRYGHTVKEQRAWHRDYYRKNKRKYLLRQRKWTKKQRENGFCVLCAQRTWRKGARHCEKHKLDMQRFNREFNQRLKLEVFKHYGGAKCACCKVVGTEFLSLHHKNGDGAAHRRRIWGRRGGIGGPNMYRWVRNHNFPPGFEVMCMNCNFALGHFGYCPHKQKGGIRHGH